MPPHTMTILSSPFLGPLVVRALRSQWVTLIVCEISRSVVRGIDWDRRKVPVGKQEKILQRNIALRVVPVRGKGIGEGIFILGIDAPDSARAQEIVFDEGENAAKIMGKLKG